MAVSFPKNGSLEKFQEIIQKIYGLPDDRLYSIWGLLAQQQRFTMRALKGIRKNNKPKIRINLFIAFSWMAAIANRLHIDMDKEVWHRFPGVCSYCTKRPCACKSIKPSSRRKISNPAHAKPQTMAELQVMFEQIYPSDRRTTADAGVHLAEEMGEVNEAVHNYLGQHTVKSFEAIPIELADYASCVFGLANSTGIDMAQELSKSFNNNCHVCHMAPCVCSFTAITKIKT